MSEQNNKIRIYTTSYCPYCHRALAYLQKLGVEFENIDVGNDPEARTQASKEAGGHSTVPMIFVGDRFIGGCNELLAKGLGDS